MTEFDCCGDCCDKCIEDAYEFIEVLVKDIQLLASEVVRLRYLLSWHLPEHTGEMVRCEIRSDLRGNYGHIQHTKITCQNIAVGTTPLIASYTATIWRDWPGAKSRLTNSGALRSEWLISSDA